MTYDETKTYLSTKNGVTNGYPFGPGIHVYKVMGKMFALIREDTNPISVNLKCDPDDALILRAQFEAVQPGYHMNKEHWNTVVFDGTISDDTLKMMIDHSYREVARKLKKSDRDKLELELSSD
ncbi:MAG: MmcQ/YjbR family DNA-binding protein [Candidatus Marinimicrobia bacterium]|nr:MmcQ/YjbR family DNA-binding protein [Candidatus Neomarinimicrobiota bacterium]